MPTWNTALSKRNILWWLAARLEGHSDCLSWTLPLSWELSILKHFKFISLTFSTSLIKHSLCEFNRRDLVLGY